MAIKTGYKIVGIDRKTGSSGDATKPYESQSIARKHLKAFTTSGNNEFYKYKVVKVRVPEEQIFKLKPISTPVINIKHTFPKYIRKAGGMK